MAIYSDPFAPPRQAPEQAHEPTPEQQAPYQPASHRTLRRWLAVFEAIMALITISGAVFVVPNMPLDVIKRGPFTDFTIPALGLGALCGGAAVVAMLAAFSAPRLAAAAAVIGGVFMIVFELVEIYVVGFTVADDPANLQAWLQVIFIAAGAIGIVLGARLWKAVTGSYRILPTAA